MTRSRNPSIVLGLSPLIAGVFLLGFVRPVSAQSHFLPARQGPDLSNAKITRDDLPAEFVPLTGNQLSTMEGLLKSAASSLSRTTDATLQNFTGFTVSDPDNLQLIIAGLIAPLSAADQVSIDRELSDTESIEGSLGASAGEFALMPGSGGFGDASMGITMTTGSGKFKMRMDYIVVRRQTVLEEVAVLYLDGRQPSISAIELTRILDDRVAAVVGGGTGVTFRSSGPLVPELTTHIPAPQDLSTDPGVIGANLFLAALIMLPFAIAAELFTRTLAENEAALRRKIKLLDWAAGLQGKLGQVVGSRLQRPGLADLAKLAGVMVFYGLVFSLLDRTWNPFSLTGLVLFVQMTVAYGLVGIADDIIQWLDIRRRGLPADLTVRPTNLLLAMASMASSRLFSMVPGLMFGTPEALRTDEAAFDAGTKSRLLKISAATFTAIIFIFWIPTIVTGLLLQLNLPQILADLLGGVEAFLLVVFAVALENTFVQTLGFPGGFGQALKRRNRWLWLGALAAVTFLFFHTLINPRGELAGAIREGNVLVLLVAAVAFMAVSFGLWWFVGRKEATGAGESAGPAIAPLATRGAAAGPGGPALPAATLPAVSVGAPTAVPAAGPFEIVSGQTKTCPACGEKIKPEARICRYCRATFEVKAKGYCVNCHAVAEVGDGRCLKCGSEAADVHYESRLLTAPPKPAAEKIQAAQKPEPVAVPASTVGDTKPCPVCGKTIKAEAKICRFCRANLTVPIPPPAAQPNAVPKPEPQKADEPDVSGPQRCPKCRGSLMESKGSPASPYINTYRCSECGWMGLKCGRSGCDGYLKPEEIGSPGTVRYNCVKCGWTGTGPRV